GNRGGRRRGNGDRRCQPGGRTGTCGGAFGHRGRRGAEDRLGGAVRRTRTHHGGGGCLARRDRQDHPRPPVPLPGTL
ncbi:MAG: hypothetical protein AVDCRST_MAG83-1627, partial [uncultured Arthrobacter sp.]